MTLKERIKQEEGLRMKPYLCPAGKRTIGYGHNLEASPLLPYIAEFLKNNGCILQHMAEDQLDHDIDVAEAVARRLFVGFDELSEARRDVLTDMAFNLGEGSLSRFAKLRHNVAIKHYENAAKEMKDSRWFTQVTNRAKQLIQQWMEG
jgi:lysozyme